MSQTLSQKKILWSKDHIKPHARVPRELDTWSTFGLRVLALFLIGITIGLLMISGELLFSHLRDWITWGLA